MKNAIIVIAALSLGGCGAAAKPCASLVGSWEGYWPGRGQSVIDIRKDGDTFVIAQDGRDAMGGKCDGGSIEVGGMMPPVTYLESDNAILLAGQKFTRRELN